MDVRVVVRWRWCWTLFSTAFKHAF